MHFCWLTALFIFALCCLLNCCSSLIRNYTWLWFMVPRNRVIISKFLQRHSKAKSRAPAYSWTLRQIKGVVQRIVRGRLRSGCQRVGGGLAKWGAQSRNWYLHITFELHLTERLSNWWWKISIKATQIKDIHSNWSNLLFRTYVFVGSRWFLPVDFPRWTPPGNFPSVISSGDFPPVISPDLESFLQRMKRLVFAKPVTCRLTTGSNDYANPNTNPTRPSQHLTWPGGNYVGEITRLNHLLQCLCRSRATSLVQFSFCVVWADYFFQTGDNFSLLWIIEYIADWWNLSQWH